MVLCCGCSDCKIWRCLSCKKVQCSDWSNETMRSLTGGAVLRGVLQCQAWRKEWLEGPAVTWRCHRVTWKRCRELMEEQRRAGIGEV